MEALAHNFIKALGWSILDSFWQCGIIYGVLLIILVCAPKLSSRLRHNLSFVSICTMFVWFCITFFSKFQIPSLAKNTLSISDSALQNYFLNNTSVNLPSKAEAYFPFIIGAYILGIVLQLLVILKGYVYVQKLKKNKLEEVSEEWDNLFRNISSKLKITKKASFKISSLVKVPMVIGYLKPVVLFPVSLCSQLDTEQVEAILIHELSHIRRNDYILNLIKTSIETFLFFNPFVWLAGRFIHIEREHACDDTVLKLTGKPVSYAHALLKLELFASNEDPKYTMAATGKPQYLFQRIKRITNMKTNYLNLKQQMAALTLALACLVSLAWVKPTEDNKINNVKAEVSHTAIPFRPGVNNTKIQVFEDTIINPAKKSTDVKIVVTDNKGNKKEYKSIKELPDSLQSDFQVFGNPSFLLKTGDSLYFKEFNSKEWKQQQEELAKKYKELATVMSKKFNSKDWQQQQVDLAKKEKALALLSKQKFNSKEWQQQQQELAKKYKKLAIEIRKKFNSKEWKMQQEDLAKNSEELALLYKEKFNSAEWQQEQKKLYEQLSTLKYNINLDSLKMNLNNTYSYTFKMLPRLTDSLFSNNKQFYFFNDELNSKIKAEKELRNSEEYKKLKSKFEKDVEKLRKKEAKKQKK